MRYLINKRLHNGKRKFICFLLCVLSININAYSQMPGGVSSGLKAWFKANANITLSGTTVTTWSNSAPSGSALDLTTVPTDPTFSKPSYLDSAINFNPAVTFNGTQGIYRPSVLGSDVAGNNYNSIFYVISNATITGASGTIVKWETSVSNRMSSELNSIGKPRFDFPSDSIPVYGNVITTNTYLFSGLLSSGIDSIIENGKFLRSTIQTDSLDNSLTGNYSLGSNLTGSFPFVGYISEIVSFNFKVGNYARNLIQTYLAIKYGITLGSTSNRIDYVNASNSVIWTGSSTYQNNILGIGRDDSSGLYQRQSKSTGGSSVLTMAILSSGAGNSIPSTNSANPNSFSANSTFLIVGDNNGSLYGNSSDLPSGISRKSARIWKSQLTGTGLSGQNVRLKFDLSSLTTLSVSDYSKYRLLLDANGVFASGATSVAPVNGSNSSKFVEFDVIMNNYSNFFFTIGTTDNSSAPLPVDFLTFEAKRTENGVLINWSTSNERDCEFFEIQASSDGKVWNQITTIHANNISNTVSNYSYLITSSNHYHYYRIKEVDHDGGFTLSKISYLNFKEAAFYKINNSLENQILAVQNIAESNLYLSMFDINGKVLYTQFILPQEIVNIDTENIEFNGVCVLRLQNDMNVGCEKIILKH